MTDNTSVAAALASSIVILLMSSLLLPLTYATIGAVINNCCCCVFRICCVRVCFVIIGRLILNEGLLLIIKLIDSLILLNFAELLLLLLLTNFRIFSFLRCSLIAFYFIIILNKFFIVRWGDIKDKGERGG